MASFISLKEVRLRCRNDDLISEAEMLELIESARASAGGLTPLARKLGISSVAPISLALKRERPVSDGISLHFGYECQRMYRRIGNASRS